MNAAPITQTGVRGFLLWLQQQQPGIYARVAPKLPALVPEAFTQINRQTLGKLRQIYKSGVARRSSQSLGDYSCYLAPITVEAPAYSNFTAYASDSLTPTVNYTAQLSAPVSYSSVCAPPPSYASVDTGTDVASAANMGNAAVGTTQAIGSAVNAVATTLLTAQDAAALANVIQSQLQNAASGRSPSAISTASLGIPTTKTGTSSDLIWLILAGLGAWAVLQ